MNNPPNTKPVTGFVVYTALAPTAKEKFFIGIEACQTGITVETTKPGPLLFNAKSGNFSKVEFVDPAKAMVETTDVNYRFTLYTTNPIP